MSGSRKRAGPISACTRIPTQWWDLTPARPPEQGRHIMMQARRNPSRAATKSQASVRVQRQCPVLAACSRDVPARVQTKRRSPSRIADLRIQSARRERAATHRTDCVRRSRMSAQSDGVTGWSGITWQASWKIRVSSVGSRDTLVAMRRHNDFSSHGKAIRLAECGRCYAQGVACEPRR